MKVGKGDKVRFLNEVGGGIVQRVDGKLAYVEDEDGFEVPSLLSDIVVVEKAGAQVEKEVVATETNLEVLDEDVVVEEEPEADDAQPRFLFALAPEGRNVDANGEVELYMINDSNFFIFYNCFSKDGVEATSLFHGVVEPNTKIFVKKVKINSLDGEYSFHLSLFKRTKAYAYHPPMESSIKLKGSQIVKERGFVENAYFNQKAKVFSLIEDEFEKKVKAISGEDLFKAVKEKEPAKKKVKRRDDKEILEVDLHIHELIDSTVGLSNGEMLNMQLDKFHEVMAANANNRGKKLVFIHGVGNGTLKIELRKELDRRYKKCDFQDASFAEYGYGATMVIVR